MSLLQKRTRELVKYVQKDVGEPDYIDPSTLVFLVDHPDWSESKGMHQETFRAGIPHVEKDRITGLQSRTVVVTFATAFTSQPVGWVEVYRMNTTADGYKRRNVLYTFPNNGQPSLTGFTLNIDQDENLFGIRVEYVFQ